MASRGLLVALALCVPALSLVIPDANDALTQLVLDPIQPLTFDDTSDPLPVVIWHGLGDSADSDGMNMVASLIEEVYPGTYVFPISLAEQGGADSSQSWFGDLNDQIDLVCTRISQDPILATAPAIDAVGFSQGGQFLRGYVERCGHWAPKVRTLMTFGSQHNGIDQFQKCAGWTDFLCNAANLLVETGLVWSDAVQKKVIPAQYFKPSADLEDYLKSSNYLADINNEREEKNSTYAENLAQLEKFVMLVFEEDKTVVPKESGWFSKVNLTNGEITPLRNRTMYKEDWLGLKRLDEKEGLVFGSVPGGHMQLRTKDLVSLFTKYFGPLSSTKAQGSTAGCWNTEDDYEAVVSEEL